MPKLSEKQKDNFVKLLFLGDSGTGKTGALVSLVAAGYNLRILDFDNGLDVLIAYVMKECPNNLANVEYVSLRDPYEVTILGTQTKGPPKAYANAMNFLTKWDDGSNLSLSGNNTVVVIDSLTGLGNAAFNWAKHLSPTAKDPRQWYHTAQQSLEQVISMLTSEAFQANVIVSAHVAFQESATGMMKAYPNSIGKAINPILPSYFNNMILASSTNDGKNVKREILTTPTHMVDLKNAVPFKIEQKYPLGTGLNTIFNTLKGK